MSAIGINMSLEEATTIADEWVEKLKLFCDRVEATGTVRRKDQETTHDIDLVLIRSDNELVQERFARLLDSLEYVKGKPDGKWCCRRLESGVMLDIRMCTEADWGWRLVQHTGPTDFYLWARAKLDGVDKNFGTEEEVFRALELDYVAPENRHKIEVDMSKIENKDVSLFGIIGFEDATLDNIIKETADEDELNLRINSPGGDGEEGLAIFDYLINLEMPVSTEIFGKAKSAAAIASQGADKGKRRMAKNASFMIHNPFMFTVGEADDLEKQAKELKEFEDRTVKLFAESTGLTQKKIRELMDGGGTEMNAKKAKELGFIDEIIGAKDMAPIVWNMADLPEEIAKQLPATRAAKTPEFRWQDASSNTNQLPIGSKIFDLRVNNQIYPMTKETFLMLGQFVQLSGKDNPDDALAYFTDLKGNKVETKFPADMLTLRTKVDTLTKNLEAKNSLIEGVQRRQSLVELKERTERIEALVDSKRIEPGTAEPLVEAYVQIDPDVVSATQRDADHDLKFLESLKPREDLIKLTKLSGSGGEGQGDDSIEDQLIKIAQAKQKEDSSLSFGGAFQIAKDENPELLSKLSEVN